MTKFRNSKLALFTLVILTALLAIAAVTQINLTTQVSGILPIANGGTNSATATGSGQTVLATSPTITTPTISGDLGGNLGLGTFGETQTIPNAGTTGTTNALLAKLTGAPSTAVITATSDIAGAIGVVVSGGSTSGSAVIAVQGEATCTADNATTAGDYVIIGTATAGRCRDGGATKPTSGQIVGRFLTSTALGSAATVELWPAEVTGYSSAAPNFADNETPTGTINGVNTTFTLAHTVSPVASLSLYKNGQLQIAGGADYTLATATITYGSAPKTGDVLTASYRF
jgi:hypothetical protein